jgi:hypothetical protein
VIAGLSEIERDMLAGAVAKPEGEDFAGAKMSVAALPAAISVISWSSVGVSVLIGLVSEMAGLSELKPLRSSADFDASVGFETASYEVSL